ncbi:MAG: sugar ABC transporter substrate-binding protein [Eubacteriales bacterium]|nr:sugar ABC transporter substrate-binding protein [Eubacteriales bacterium]
MKRMLSILLVIALLVMCISGCAQKQEGETTESEENTESAEVEESVGLNEWGLDPTIKIGVSCWNFTSDLGLECYEYITMAAEALGCEIITESDGFDPDEQVTVIENMVAAGCDAVYLCNCSEAILPKLIDTCEENEVYFGLFMRTINDPDIKQLAVDSPYFVGVCHEDEVMVGYNLGIALADTGAKNVGFITWNRGDATAEDRYEGYTRAFEERGVTIIAEEWEVLTSDQGAAALERFAAAYPEMDGVVACGGGGEPLAGIMSAMQNLGLTGEIPLVASDFGPDIANQLNNGEISAMTGGHAPDCMFEFMLLYNTVAGTPLSDEDYVELLLNPIVLTSYEDATEYDEWCKGDVKAYTPEEIRMMSKTYNPDLTIEQLKEMVAAYSVDDVIARHS